MGLKYIVIPWLVTLLWSTKLQKLAEGITTVFQSCKNLYATFDGGT